MITGLRSSSKITSFNWLSGYRVIPVAYLMNTLQLDLTICTRHLLKAKDLGDGHGTWSIGVGYFLRECA